MEPPVASQTMPVDAAVVAGWAAALVGAGNGLDDVGRVELLGALERLKSAAAAVQARVAVDFADSQQAEQAAAGLRPERQGQGVAAQVALARSESPHRGGRLLGLARALVTEMPQTLVALETGLTNEWRAMLVARETACLSRQDRGTVDALLWAVPQRAAAMGDRALAARARALAARLDPQAMVDRAARAEKDRHVSIRPAPDTMTYLTGLLPVAQGVAAWAALSRAADTARATGDPRSRGQVMADTLVERLTGNPVAADVPVTVMVVMTDTTLLQAGPEPALVPGHGPIPAGIARQLAARSARAGTGRLRRLYTHPETGALVALESKSRRFTGGLADFIDLRDQTCRTPWCDAPIRHHDHISDHAAGGPTAAGNGQGLCEACNHTKQAPGWRAGPGPDGLIETTTPTRHSYVSYPPAMPGAPPPSTRPPPRLDLTWGSPITWVA